MVAKRKVYCRHCNKHVTTETFKQHLQLQKGLPRLPRPKKALQRLRQELRRLSSQRSIDGRRNATPMPTPPPPKHFDSPNAPMKTTLISMESHNESQVIIPEVDMDDLWERIQLSRPTLVDLPDETMSWTRTYVSTKSSKSTYDPPSALSTESELEVEYDPATYGLAPGAFVREHLLVKAAEQAPHMLAPDSRDTIMDFNFFVKEKTGVRTHEAMRKTYCHQATHTSIPSLKDIRRQMLALSALKAVDYHSCRNSCICYAGYLKDLNECPYCHSLRLNPAGAPYAIFSFIPLIPQLLAMFRNPATYNKMLYRSQHIKDGEAIKDIFDGLLYEFLCKSRVFVDGEQLPFKHFEDFRELALMIMLDGMAPFKKRKHSCWPIIIVNFNLKPNIRMHQDNIICIGAIPGPHSPKDLNSFLQPLIDELVQLAKGVEAVDVVRKEVFSLRAHLIAAGGDLPAISKLMEFIGHNGRLPLRTHEQCLAQGYNVLQAPNDHARANRATECGIKGVTLLARLSSVRIPDSFPVEVMHMVWINLIPQLMDLWQENFHNFDSGSEEYTIDPLLVNAIGNLCTESGATFPSDFGARVPHFRNRSHFTAETWSIWALHYAPYLLRRRFSKSKYYVHFVRLITILNEVMDYEIPQSKISRIRKDIAEWIQDFEQIYYQHDSDRLQICTTNVHYLLMPTLPAASLM
ncbi:unnamed protein product [Rhizoctonia solani]|uniref:Transposase family Tnp2 protein n=1 Tax=Rhizoctonia solani TaxID=456999 RepID=A0A8H3AV30_9AGAM|nr:unnamed protein product [Rhizoctonia solani]